MLGAGDDFNQEGMAVGRHRDAVCRSTPTPLVFITSLLPVIHIICLGVGHLLK